MPSSTQQSPVLYETSPPPPHTWSNSEALSTRTRSPTPFVEHPGANTMPEPPSQQGAAQASSNHLEDVSSSDSSSSASTETPQTASTPRSDPIPMNDPAPSSQTNAEPSTTDPVTSSAQEGALETRPDEETAAAPIDSALLDLNAIVPPPLPIDLGPPPARDDIPSWVRHEEDTSVPSAEELKEIDAKERELSATDFKAMEKEFFQDLGDPELRPVKRLRLSWTVKGVRGTRDKPNRARIMTSPTFQHEGYHWSIKLFPRGNKSRTSLAAFIRCSTTPLPKTGEEALEGRFTCYAGGADDEELEQVQDSILTPVIPEDTKSNTPDKESAPAALSPPPPPPPPPPTTAAVTADVTGLELSLGTVEHSEHPLPTDHHHNHDDSSSSDDSSDDDDVSEVARATQSIRAKRDQEDFRVSAQLGMVVYNPDEPRTCYEVSSKHQFCPHEDDWGWDSLISRWEDIHRRKHGQRQALLRNDTLVIDAYIRIFDDPSKALFWHSSAGESQWDSKLLAGYYPMGTRLLYHSPAVAGLTAWSLLRPLRQIIQSVDAGSWMKDSSAKPRTLLASLQLMLFQMRHMNKDETYIHLDNVIREVESPGETFQDVKAFWEVFRRSMELELDGDANATAQLADIFGAYGLPAIPALPVHGMKDVQEAATEAFTKASFKGELPNFLPLMLDRQSFDASTREWKLHNDRVRLNDELDLSAFCSSDDAHFSLYGFVVHDGERNSGRFYSVVRPTGPGGKWLAFSDGNGNKVFSYTRKALEEFEGLAGDELKKSVATRQTAYLVMYLRTSCVQDYLLPALEPYSLPIWLKPFIEESYIESPDNFDRSDEIKEQDQVEIELFWDASIVGHQGTINMYNMKTSEKSKDSAFWQKLLCHPDVTFKKLKEEIASVLKVSDTELRVWTINFYGIGHYSKAFMHTERLDTRIGDTVSPGEVLCLWLALTVEPPTHENVPFGDLFRNIGGLKIEAPPPVLEIMADIETATPAASHQEPNNPTGADGGVSGEISTSENIVATTSALAEAALASAENHVSAPDAEQDSIRQAVANDVQQHRRDADSGVGPQATNDRNESPDSPVIAVRNSVDGEEILEIFSSSSAVRPVETQHAEHVVEAVPGQDSVAGPVHTEHALDGSSLVNPFLVTGAAAAPSGEATTVTVETTFTEIPGDLSAEDAALISSMIAADMVAVERERHNLEGVGHRSRSRSRGRDEVSNSRPSTPSFRHMDVYGFLEIFDSESQTITVKTPFFTSRDTKIGDLVRTRLQYETDHNFQMYRREGACGTTTIEQDATFIDLSLEDGCDIIVGEALSESKVEELKKQGKFSSPGDLISYIVSVRHRHPVLSRTSGEPVEIAGFGTDYYRGPLVRGQRHGSECLIITSNGETYQGPMVAGQKSGSQGKMIYANGDEYKGDWLDDARHGQGEFIEQRTGNRYVGGYENDKRWGRGITYWEVADQQADLCQICYFQDVDALFYECGHVCACYACAKECDSCPVCRNAIRAVVKMYRS